MEEGNIYLYLRHFWWIISPIYRNYTVIFNVCVMLRKVCNCLEHFQHETFTFIKLFLSGKFWPMSKPHPHSRVFLEDMNFSKFGGIFMNFSVNSKPMVSSQQFSWDCFFMTSQKTCCDPLLVRINGLASHSRSHSINRLLS